MAEKNIKLKNGEDIVYPQTKIGNILNDDGTKLQNFGNAKYWVDMSQYVNTEYFAPRPGLPPRARKIGKVVYWMGYVYCIKDSLQWTSRIMQNLPEWARCDSEFSRGFVMWESWISGVMLTEDDHILIGQNTEIKSVGQSHWRAYSLGTISGYISKGE